MAEPLRVRWVEEPEGVRRVAEACGAAGVLALDTEADSLHSYFHKVCLVQVSAAGRHFVLDPLALAKDALEPLWTVLADPAIPTLMHGADYDVRVLDRDFGAHIAGLQDTQIMAQLLGEPRTGLAALLEQELGVTLDKRFQRADWGDRPLRADHLEYAAADTAHLEKLAGRLRLRLQELGRWGWAEEEFRRLEAVRHQTPAPDPLAFERLPGARRLKGAARDRLHGAWRWREEEAQRRDVPPFKVASNRSLLAAALEPPADLDELAALDGLGPRFARRHGRALLACLNEPEPAPPAVRGNRPRGVEPDRQRVKRLQAARDELATGLGIEPGLLCARAVAEEVAVCQPTPRTLEDLRRCGLTGWRLGQLGERFLAALQDDDAAT